VADFPSDGAAQQDLGHSFVKVRIDPSDISPEPRSGSLQIDVD
jgi:hypothetical protein